ncbi:hypothetical protein KDA23_06760, partial [Candidatus Saccharibacteria bacterium]|nr:hypothetical protein [Candidatus Saccharibacteria bacterium]
MQHLVDHNDLAFIYEKGFRPKGFAPCPRSSDGHINPQVTRLYLGDNQFVSVFHVKPVYYETITGHWRPLSEVTVHHGNRKIILHPDALSKMSPRFMRWLQLRQRILGTELLFDSIGIQPRHMVFSTTSTFFPDPNAETTTVDGYSMYSSNSNWNTVHYATDGTSADDSSESLDSRTEYRFNGQWYICRVITLFDTSSLPDSDTISAASLTVEDTANSYQNMADTTNCFHAVVQTQATASNTAVGTADYDLVGDAIDNPTEAHDAGERLDTSGGVPGAGVDVTWDFNATGISWISKTGLTRLGIRSGEDITDTPGSQGTADRNRFMPYSADTAGTT